MCAPNAPPPPDYAALARQQGLENKDSTLFNTNINRADQITPQGSVTWATKPGANPTNPQPGDYTQTTAYSPAQQGLFDSQNRISQNLADVGEAGLSRVGQQMTTPFNTAGLPGLQSAPGIQQNARSGAPVNSISGGANYGDQRTAIEQAFMSRLQPRLDADRAGLENRLLNSGIEKGSNAWNTEMNNSNQQRNDAYVQSVLAGGQEQSRLAGLDLAQGGFANSAQNQTFGQQSSIDALMNAMQGRNAAFNNQARTQGIQEEATLRQAPLNELNALRTGAQVQNPQFSNYYTGASAQPAPMFDAGVAQGNYDQASYKNQQSGYNALLGGLANLGSAFMPFRP